MDQSASDDVIVVTGSGPDSTGWFFLVDRDARAGWTIERLDGVNSFGIVVQDDRVYRMLCSTPGFASSAELLIYDERGVAGYRRLDGVTDPHGIAWTGSRFAVPCPPENGIALLDDGGAVADWIHLPGSGDAWHVNGVAVRDGMLYCTAFGRFAAERDWASTDRSGCGLIFDPLSGTAVIDGLHCPHDPTVNDDGWLVCDSGSGRLLAFSPAGELLRAVVLGAWTRGLALLDDRIAVGLSGSRHSAQTPELATLAILDRQTWRELERISLPCQEIQTVVRIPRRFIGALRRGFRTNAMRTSVLDRAEMFRQVGNIHPSQPLTPMTELEPADVRIVFDARPPKSIAAGERFTVSVRVKNEGSRTLFTAMPFPILIGFQWLNATDAAEIDPLDERRHALPEPIPPGMTLELDVPVAAPSTAGRYRLRMTLVQEWLRWFDAADPTMGAEMTIAIAARRSQSVFGESQESAREHSA